MPPSALLLDTHIFLWWRINARELTRTCRAAIETATGVYVSAASAWEAAIKAALGKLEIPESFERGVEDSQFERLPITFRHAELAGRLPPHHRDPFDRMLISQATIEGLTLVTHDRRLEHYGIEVLWNQVEGMEASPIPEAGDDQPPSREDST